MRGSTAGLSEIIISPKNSAYNILLELLDTIISTIIIAPNVVSYWRGTWNLMNDYLYPNDFLSSSIASLLIGIIGHLLFTLCQNLLNNQFKRDVNRLTFYIMSRFYTYLFGIVCINGWRGGWQLIDYYTGGNIFIVMFITITSVLLLIIVKGLRNISASPFFLATDNYKDYFDIPTMFKISGTREPGLYVLDCLFSVLVIGSLVVFVWRGAWVLLDLKLFPDDKIATAWGSLVIGYGVVGITFGLQPVMRWACERLQGAWRVGVADLFLFFSFIGTVNVWRGVWNLLDLYFLPENKLLSDWLTHSVSLILLALLNCSNSVLVRGVYIDAEEPAGQCVIFPVYYIRLFFQKERTKKQKRLIDALEKQDQNNTLLLIEKPTTNHSIIVKNNSHIIRCDNNEKTQHNNSEQTIFLSK